MYQTSRFFDETRIIPYTGMIINSDLYYEEKIFGMKFINF